MSQRWPWVGFGRPGATNDCLGYDSAGGLFPWKIHDVRTRLQPYKCNSWHTEPRISHRTRVGRLIEAAKQNRCRHRDATAILVAYRHGLRASVVVALRWGDIDLATGRFHVRTAKGGDANVASRLHLGTSRATVRSWISAHGRQGGRGCKIQFSCSLAHAPRRLWAAFRRRKRLARGLTVLAEISTRRLALLSPGRGGVGSRDSRNKESSDKERNLRAARSNTWPCRRSRP
jgi:integrase